METDWDGDSRWLHTQDNPDVESPGKCNAEWHIAWDSGLNYQHQLGFHLGIVVGRGTHGLDIPSRDPVARVRHRGLCQPESLGTREAGTTDY